MEDQIIIKGRLEPKTNILKAPEMYTDTALLVFILPEAYKQPFMKYFYDHNMKDPMELTIRPWPLNKTDRATKFFFKLRDRIAEAQGDTSRENKNNLYRSAVKELGLKKEGTIINSLKDLDKTGLFLATEVLHQWAVEAEAYISDLIPEYKASQANLKEK